ncbi:hypothetical protein GQ54DRAFT_314169, partial [Martensiomyces pterosporus]
MSPRTTRRTSRSLQHAEDTEQPASESDQRSFSDAEEPISSPEDEPQAASPLQRALPRISLSDAAARIKVFSGEHPLVTSRWLKRVETLYPEGSVWYEDRLTLASMRLEGKAKAVYEKAQIDNWEAFKKCLLKVYNSETAAVLLEEQLDNRSRYKGMPPMEALQLAVCDRLDLGWYYGADTNDRLILSALMVIFPETVLSAMEFKQSGDFDTQVSQLEQKVIAANIRNNADSKWAREGHTQTFNATIKDKKGKKGKRSSKKTESAAAPPA